MEYVCQYVCSRLKYKSWLRKLIKRKVALKVLHYFFLWFFLFFSFGYLIRQGVSNIEKAELKRMKIWLVISPETRFIVLVAEIT